MDGIKWWWEIFENVINAEGTKTVKFTKTHEKYIKITRINIKRKIQKLETFQELILKYITGYSCNTHFYATAFPNLLVFRTNVVKNILSLSFLLLLYRTLQHFMRMRTSVPFYIVIKKLYFQFYQGVKLLKV